LVAATRAEAQTQLAEAKARLTTEAEAARGRLAAEADALGRTIVDRILGRPTR
jgi:hypothetical protein